MGLRKSLHCVFFLLMLAFCKWHGVAEEDRKVYIVYMGPQNQYLLSSNHVHILQEVLDQSSTCYILTVWCAPGMEGVVSVFPSRTLRLHTTRSWDFMGFPQFLCRNPVFESDVIMGVLDTGIWPESESFNDKGIGPVPKKWKGACHGGEDFICNRKIIGSPKLCMRRLGKGPRWTWNSHASIAAGRLTKNANYYGLGQGSARGAVPSARIAAYKVCEPPPHGCPEFAIMAAFDDAIADGVDIISISAGPGVAGPFDGDSIAIGAFHAMAKGVLTVQSAGSSGPESSCVCNVVLCEQHGSPLLQQGPIGEWNRASRDHHLCYVFIFCVLSLFALQLK